MKNRVTLATLACILSSVMLLASCSSAPTAPATQAPGAAPATTQAAPGQATTTAPATSPAAASPTAAAAQKPQYGGSFTTAIATDPTNFDSGTKGQGGYLTGGLVYEQYMGADWMNGPAGGGPPDYLLQGTHSVKDLYGPELAKSWKMPKQGVWILEIRQGVHWQKTGTPAGQLMNGREVTADDIVASLKRLLAAPKAWMNVSAPQDAKATTVEKTGPWEVTIKTPIDLMISFFWIIQGGGFNALYPPEVVAKYGDVADWHNTVGTGPFMLTDYTKGSSLTFTKNPDYWGTNLAGPGKGDKLPYIDTYKQLIIPDVSTQLAAFRTGKIDALPTVTKEDEQPIVKENSKILSYRYFTNFGPLGTYGFAMNIKKSPFNDKRVRQAMVLGTDFNSLVKTLYGGDAEIDVWPANKSLPDLYQPLSAMPQSVQDLYKYDPTKAKQLLADAGYPNGFKTSVVTSNVPQLTDELSVFKDQWSKIGIDLTIQPMDNAAFVAMENARSNPALIYRPIVTFIPPLLDFAPYRGPNTNNPSFINDPPGSDPAVESVYKVVDQNMFTDWPAVYKAYSKLKPALLENAYVITRPTPYVYNLWWPWDKDYYGTATSYLLKYMWVDQQLKKSMGH